AHVGANLLARELADGRLEKLFVFTERRQRKRSGLDGIGSRRHIATVYSRGKVRNRLPARKLATLSARKQCVVRGEKASVRARNTLSWTVRSSSHPSGGSRSYGKCRRSQDWWNGIRVHRPIAIA